MMDFSLIRNDIFRLSGSGKRVLGTRTNGIYTSFTLNGLDDINYVRDTFKRFVDFGIPDDLTGKTLIDIGSNVGAMAFEAALRGAKVTGVEYRQDRVDLSNIIANYYELNARFHQEDFNSYMMGKAEWCYPHDIVLCCSVDQYVDNREPFYEMLRDLCKDILYFECNIQRERSVEQTIEILNRAGFPYVTYIGNGHSGGIARKRKLYRARVREQY